MHISIVDIIIVLLITLSFFRGYQTGFIHQLGSTIGFVVGLYPGTLLSSWAMTHVTGQAKLLAGLAVLLTISILCMTAAEMAALRLKLAIRNKIIWRVDNSLGALIAVVTILFGVWLAGALFQLTPSSSVQGYVKDSQILGLLNRKLPPATSMLNNLSKLINPNDSPEVFAGREPSPSATYTVPSTVEYSTILASVRPSVVKVLGLGCGGIVDGSGFVYSPGRVVTNAHVVAGVKNPTVTDADGTHPTVVVLFDPINDIAVLRVDKLLDQPLVIDTKDASQGTQVFALGYPGGGGYQVQPGVIMDEFSALGQDIYNKQRTVRSVYGIQSTIVPGNSGGPLIDTLGHVRGVVFATSTTYNNVGYALTTAQVSTELARATTASTVQSTGQCSE